MINKENIEKLIGALAYKNEEIEQCFIENKRLPQFTPSDFLRDKQCFYNLFGIEVKINHTDDYKQLEEYYIKQLTNMHVAGERELPVGTPVMVTDITLDGDMAGWTLRFYAEGDKCFNLRNTEMDKSRGMSSWRYIIPFDKFNPNNIDESLKYNIVK